MHQPPGEHLIERTSSPENKEKIWARIEEEYQRNVEMLNASRILEFLPELNAMGIRDEYGRCFSLPTIENVHDAFDKNWPLIEHKWQQGFTRLQLTPIAMSLPHIARMLSETISLFHQRGQLFSANPALRGMQIQLVDSKPVPTKLGAEQKSIRYFPKNLDKKSAYDHHDFQGVAKDRVIRHTIEETTIPGWHICLIEPTLILPVNGHSQEKGGRWQLTTGARPADYFSLLQKPEYSGETGFTIEDFLIYFLSQILETGQIAAASDNDHSGVWCLGNYNSRGEVYYAGWLSSSGRLAIGPVEPFNAESSKRSVRTAVRLF